MSEIKVTNGRKAEVVPTYSALTGAPGIRTVETVPADIADELLRTLMAYRFAQSRMLSKWADGDENVKCGLWKSLHDCEFYALNAIERATLDPKP